MPRISRAWIAVSALLVLLMADPAHARRAKGFYHVVKAGETLWGIARRYGVPFDKLVRVNRIKNPDLIRRGERIFVPSARAPKRKRSSKPRCRHSSRPPAGAPRFIRPLEGKVTSRYGPRWGRLHSGIDIAAPSGVIITAAAAGRVVRADSGWRRYGKIVLIDHGKGYFTLYAHCSRIFVKKGQRVRKRQAVAAVGATGNATGPHLHFEIWRDGRAVDPEPFLPRGPAVTRIARRSNR